VSAAAYREYASFRAAHPDVPSAWLDVIAQRPWSLEVALRTGVRHESPQALWLSSGRALWHASHGGVTAAALGSLVTGSRS
jgi:bacillithiol system protein YtxJ